ncbi:Heterokaryon incompatibility protein 6, OR allele [Cytospora mali]|uniref:Heterokaryon incompatibility protein 6, OR allele n=1 Tax=Cytospora mali TaxID=578113 RepID=A0A194VZQ0_CYTMA|nr:Heterokaryon incompatibility protein 6, OR allele [Valsa mali]
MAKKPQPDGEVPAFSHDPLPDDSSYIRLLTINNLELDETRPTSVSCELTTWPITEAPEYLAISYTWGDERHLTTILVNGKPMQVRRNCEYALQQAKWYDGPRRPQRLQYWVDAICVNQMDSKEKGHQLAIMGTIYKNAERVLACVGEHDKESKYLYRKACVPRNSAIFTKLGDLKPALRYWVPSYLQNDVDKWQRSMQKPALTRLFHALHAFLERPYFSRVLVYQELFHGKRVSVHCGKERLSIRLFSGMAVAAKYWYHTMFYSMQHFYTMHPELSAPTINDVHIKRMDKVSHALLERGSWVTESLSLEYALQQVWDLNCADPRDRVYGVISVVDWENKPPICPDYTKDRLEIAIEAIGAIETLGSSQDLPKVEKAARSLDLIDHPSRQLAEAIQRRRRSSQHSVNTNQKHHHRIQDSFQGWLLAQEEGKWELSHSQPYDKAPILVRSLGGYLSSREASAETNAHTIILPPTTQAGDWLLVKYLSEDLCLALIGRQQADGRFDIVGKGAISPVLSDMPYGDDHTLVDVHFDIEDSIVLICEGEGFRSGLNHVPDDKFTEYLETKVCGQVGSSYAEMRGISHEKDAGADGETDAS